MKAADQYSILSSSTCRITWVPDTQLQSRAPSRKALKAAHIWPWQILTHITHNTISTALIDTHTCSSSTGGVLNPTHQNHQPNCSRATAALRVTGTGCDGRNWGGAIAYGFILSLLFQHQQPLVSDNIVCHPDTQGLQSAVSSLGPSLVCQDVGPPHFTHPHNAGSACWGS